MHAPFSRPQLARSTFATVVAGMLLVGPSLGGAAWALPLCENVTDLVCREDVTAAIGAARTALVDGVVEERDRRSVVADLTKALQSFASARREISDPGATLTEEKICARAGKQDDRGLKSAARAVKNAEKIAASKYASQAAFDAAQTALGALVQSLIDAVNDNADEVEALTGEIPAVDDARGRVETAQENLDAGNLGKAADDAQRAYDRIRDWGNLATCLDNQQ